MKLLELIKNFRKSKKEVVVSDDSYPEEAQKMIAEVFKSGKAMVGGFDENGKWYTKVIEEDEK